MKNIVKILILVIISITIISTMLFFYFKPTEQKLGIFDNLNEQKLEYEDFNQHLNETPQAYFFCAENNQNCSYTHNEIIKPLALSASTDRFEKIYFVNASKLDENVLPSAIKSRLGFSHYPAFVVISKVQDKIVVHSVLEWNDNMNFTKIDLKDWMIQNGLWLDEYTD